MVIDASGQRRAGAQTLAGGGGAPGRHRLGGSYMKVQRLRRSDG